MASRLTSPQQVGRTAEMAVLSALLAGARQGVRFVAISGEAGIGKSRMLAELAVTSRATGFAVHVGGCPPLVEGPTIPFAAMTQALRSILRSVDARSLDALLGDARLELARLLPEVGTMAHDSPEAAHHGVARLYEAILLLIERTASPHGMVLVLEDMHWADLPTRAILSYLCRNLGDTPVLVAVSYRSEALPAGDQLPDLLHELARVSGGELLHLAPLVPADARMLLELIDTGQHTDDELATIVRRSAGVPLYLEELSLPTGMSGEAGPPPSMRTSVDGRLARLPPDARLMVELLAVCSGPTDARLLIRASGLPDTQADTAFRQGIDSHLLVVAGEAGQQLDMRHDLIREAVVAGMVPGRSPSLHERLARALMERPSLGAGTEAEQTSALAQHLLAAGEEWRAVPVLLRAADASCLALDFTEADRAYRRAFDIVGDASPPFPGARWVECLVQGAMAAWLAGDPARAAVLQARAISRLDDQADPMALSMARVHLGRYLADDGRHLEALDVLAASARLPTTPLVRLRAHMEQVRIHLALRDHDAAVELARVAVVLAEASGAKREAARAYASLGVALSMNGQHPEALLALTEARSIPRASDTQVRARASRFPDSLLGYVDASTVLARAGEIEAARQAALDGLEAARRLRLRGAWSQVITATAALTLLRDGRWEQAREILAGSEPGGDGGPYGAIVLAILDVRQGQLARAQWLLDVVEHHDVLAGPGYGWLGLRAAAIAELDWSRGSHESARRAIVDSLQAADMDNDRLQRAEVAALGLRIEAEAALAARDRRDLSSLDGCERTGLALYAQASSDLAARQASEPGLDEVPNTSGLLARLQADLSRLRGNPDPGVWRDAIMAADRTSDRYAGADARLRLAECLMQIGGARAEAARELRACHEMALELGAAPLVEAVRRLAMRSRLVISASPVPAGSSAAQTPRAATVALGLSQREVDVLELLALGRTDREIAQHLFISEKTAGHHVSHILGKLAVSRRGEAAAIAHRLGLLGDERSSLDA